MTCRAACSSAPRRGHGSLGGGPAATPARWTSPVPCTTCTGAPCPQARACTLSCPQARACTLSCPHARACTLSCPHARACTLSCPHARACTLSCPHARACTLSCPQALLPHMRRCWGGGLLVVAASATEHDSGCTARVNRRQSSQHPRLPFYHPWLMQRQAHPSRPQGTQELAFRLNFLHRCRCRPGQDTLQRGAPAAMVLLGSNVLLPRCDAAVLQRAADSGAGCQARGRWIHKVRGGPGGETVGWYDCFC